MRRSSIFVRCLASALLALQCCAAVFAQEEKNGLSADKESSRSGLTGASTGGVNTTAARAGGADGQGNPALVGERHPLYRLRRSDVVEISFTVAPEFNQTLTVQPDGYVMLKDAGMVEVQGLNLQQFVEAVQKAYRGYLHDPQVAVSLKDFDRPYFIVRAGGKARQVRIAVRHHRG